jgi:hypothetical protein
MKTCIVLMSPLGKRKPWEHIITKNPGGTFSHLSNIKDPIRLQVSLLYYLYIIPSKSTSQPIHFHSVPIRSKTIANFAE